MLESRDTRERGGVSSARACFLHRPCGRNSCARSDSGGCVKPSKGSAQKFTEEWVFANHIFAKTLRRSAYFWTMTKPMKAENIQRTRGVTLVIRPFFAAFSLDCIFPPLGKSILRMQPAPPSSAQLFHWNGSAEMFGVVSPKTVSLTILELTTPNIFTDSFQWNIQWNICARERGAGCMRGTDLPGELKTQS